MAEKKQKKIKKRRWVELIAPKLLGQSSLGTTLVQDPKMVMGKEMRINLMTLTNNPRNQNTNVSLKVTELKDNKGFTQFTGYEITRSSIRRVVRRGKTKIETTLNCRTSDNKVITLKLFLICINEINKPVATSLRKAAIKFLTEEIAKTSYEDLIGSLLSNNVSKTLKSHLAKVYPMKICHVRYMKLIMEGKAPEKPKEEKSEEKKEEPKPASATEPQAEEPTEEKKVEEKPAEEAPETEAKKE